MRVVQGLILPLALLAVGVAAFLGLAASKAPPERQEARVDVPLVEVAAAAAAPTEGFGITVNGTVVPRRVIRLAAEVEGRIIEKSDRCEPGFAVRAGDVLLRIDPRELELQQKALEADLAQIRADLMQLDVETTSNASLIALSERELDLQQRERQRVVDLARRNSASQAELESADRQVLTSQRALQTLQNERNTFGARREKLEALRANAEARLEQIRYDLDRTTITAPTDGVIVEAPVEVNGYVRPGEALASIEDTSSLEVRCNLQMEDLYWLAKSTRPTGSPGEWLPNELAYRIPEAPATVRYRLAGETATWPARLYRYEGGGIDERTRTVPCRLAISETDNQGDLGPLSLRRGMFVEVTLQAGDSSVPLLSIPREALRPNGEVWTVRDGALRIVGVEVVRMLDDRVVVRGERDEDHPAPTLGPDDLLIVSPLPTPVDGMAVRLLGDVEPTAAPTTDSEKDLMPALSTTAETDDR